MDNASAEYTFIATFFKHEPLKVESLQDVNTPSIATFDSSHSVSESGMFTPRQTNLNLPSMDASVANLKEEQAAADSAWKQVIDPVLEYTKASLNEHRHAVDF
jgi:vacuolar protein sorting-associated protein 52